MIMFMLKATGAIWWDWYWEEAEEPEWPGVTFWVNNMTMMIGDGYEDADAENNDCALYDLHIHVCPFFKTF